MHQEKYILIVNQRKIMFWFVLLPCHLPTDQNFSPLYPSIFAQKNKLVFLFPLHYEKERLHRAGETKKI